MSDIDKGLNTQLNFDRSVQAAETVMKRIGTWPLNITLEWVINSIRYSYFPLVSECERMKIEILELKNLLHDRNSDIEHIGIGQDVPNCDTCPTCNCWHCRVTRYENRAQKIT